MEKVRPYLKWACYYILLLLLYALQTTPHLFEVFSVKPVLIVPLIVGVCMFESVMPAGAFAIIGGFLWDISSDKLMGFNAIIFVACGMFISLLCIYYLHTKIMNYLGFCLAVMLIQGALNYLFYFAIWDYSNTYLIFLYNILPTIAYTLIAAIPIFFIVRKISDKFNDVARV